MNNSNNPFSCKPNNNNPFLAGDKNLLINSTNNQSNQQVPQNNNPEINQNNSFPPQGNLFVNKNPNTNPLESQSNLPFSFPNNKPNNPVSNPQPNNPLQNPINNIFNTNNNTNPLNPISSNTNLIENKEKSNPFLAANIFFSNQQLENNNNSLNFANNKISNPLSNNNQQNANKNNESLINNIFGGQAQQNNSFSGIQNNNTATFNINNQSAQFLNQNNSVQNNSGSENLNKSNSSNQNGNNNNNLSNLERKPESINTDNKNIFSNLNKQLSFGDGKFSTGQNKLEDKNIKPGENLNNSNNLLSKTNQDFKSNTNIELNPNDPNKPKGAVLGSSTSIFPPIDLKKDQTGFLNNPKPSEGLIKPEVNFFKNDSSKNLLNNSNNNANDKKIESNVSKDPKINFFGSNNPGNLSNNIIKPEIADSNKPKEDNKIIPNNFNVNKPNVSQDNSESVNKGLNLDSRN